MKTPDCSVIQSALATDPRLSRLPVKYRVDAGKLTLVGQVHSYFEKQMVQEALRNVQGIREIENHLDVVAGV